MDLAPELLTVIVDYLAEPSSADSALDLCRFSRCSRLFHNVSSHGQLWREMYMGRWRRHRSHTLYIELLFRDASVKDAVSWKHEYGLRHIEDRAALQCVEKIVAEPVGRYAEARFILQEAKMGVFDSLLNYQQRLHSSAAFYENLSHKVWLRELLDALRRAESLQTWHRLLPDTSSSTATIECISAFSGFRGADKVEMEDKFESLATYTVQRLGVQYLQSHPDPREVSLGICEAMKDKGLGPSPAHIFHRMQNAFLNLVIDNHASTLPMSLVCIFCAIAQRLGLRASVINFPNRIIARVDGWIDSDESEQESYLLDIFEGGITLSDTAVRNRLAFIGIPQSSAENFLHPAAPSEVITRVGRNIIESLTREDGGISGSSDNARSAHAAVAALLFIQPMVDALPNLIHQFPMDVYSIHGDYIPIVQREGLEGMLMSERLTRIEQIIMEKDAQDIVPRLRAQELLPEQGDTKEILHHLGMIFRHRRWGYIGVIKRWDPRCCADESWILSNGVDSLDNGGRQQPFYSINADDGSERYIAQINIIPMKTVHLSTLNRIISSHSELGKTFVRADPDSAIFVMDEGSRRKYPEDAAWQDKILQGSERS